MNPVDDPESSGDEADVIRALHAPRSELSDLLFAYNPARFEKTVEKLKQPWWHGGRKWILDELNSWLQIQDSRLFILFAESGVGKSTVAAFYSEELKKSDSLFGNIFFNFNNGQLFDPKEIIISLAFQLIHNFPSIRDRLIAALNKLVDENNYNTMKLFDAIIIEPLQAHCMITENSTPEEIAEAYGTLSTMVIVLDGLDEIPVKYRKSILQFITVSLLTKLPPCIKVLITTRPEQDIQEWFQSYPKTTIPVTDTRYSSDVEQYLQQRLRMILPAQYLSIVIESLLRKSQGKWLYFTLLQKEFLALRKRFTTTVTDNNNTTNAATNLAAEITEETLLKILADFPNSIEEAYNQWFTQIIKFLPIELSQKQLPKLLQFAVAAYEPLKYTDMQYFLNLSESDFQVLQQAVQPFILLESVEEDHHVLRFRIHHYSLIEWCLRPPPTTLARILHTTRPEGYDWSVADAHATIADRLLSMIQIKLSDPNFLIQLQLTLYLPNNLLQPGTNYLYSYLLQHLDEAYYDHIPLQFLTSFYWMQAILQFKGMKRLYEDMLSRYQSNESTMIFPIKVGKVTSSSVSDTSSGNSNKVVRIASPSSPSTSSHKALTFELTIQQVKQHQQLQLQKKRLIKVMHEFAQFLLRNTVLTSQQTKRKKQNLQSEYYTANMIDGMFRELCIQILGRFSSLGSQRSSNRTTKFVHIDNLLIKAEDWLRRKGGYKVYSPVSSAPSTVPPGEFNAELNTRNSVNRSEQSKSILIRGLKHVAEEKLMSIFDFEQGSRIQGINALFQSSFSSLAQSTYHQHTKTIPLSSFVVTIYGAGYLRLWDIISGECLNTIVCDPDSYCMTVISHAIIAIGYLEKVEFWNVFSSQMVFCWQIKGYAARFLNPLLYHDMNETISFTEDFSSSVPRYLVGGFTDFDNEFSKMVIYDLRNKEVVLNMSLPDAINSFQVIPHTTKVLYTCLNELYFVDISTPLGIHTGASERDLTPGIFPMPSLITNICILSNRDILIVQPQELIIFDYIEEQELKVIPLLENKLCCCVIKITEECIAIGYGEGDIVLFNTESETEIAWWHTEISGSISMFCYLPEEELLLSCLNYDSHIFMWNLSNIIINQLDDDAVLKTKKIRMSTTETMNPKSLKYFSTKKLMNLINSCRHIDYEDEDVEDEQDQDTSPKKIYDIPKIYFIKELNQYPHILMDKRLDQDNTSAMMDPAALLSAASAAMEAASAAMGATSAYQFSSSTLIAMMTRDNKLILFSKDTLEYEVIPLFFSPQQLEGGSGSFTQPSHLFNILEYSSELLIFVYDTVIAIFNVLTKEIETIFDEYVTCFILTQSSRFVGGHLDGTIKIWSPSRLKQLFHQTVHANSILLIGHTKSVLSLAIIKDNGNLISCALDNTIRIWEKSKSYRCLQVLDCHAYQMNVIVNIHVLHLFSGEETDEAFLETTRNSSNSTPIKTGKEDEKSNTHRIRTNHYLFLLEDVDAQVYLWKYTTRKIPNRGPRFPRLPTTTSPTPTTNNNARTLSNNATPNAQLRALAEEKEFDVVDDEEEDEVEVEEIIDERTNPNDHTPSPLILKCDVRGKVLHIEGTQYFTLLSPDNTTLHCYSIAKLTIEQSIVLSTWTFYDLLQARYLPSNKLLSMENAAVNTFNSYNGYLLPYHTDEKIGDIFITSDANQIIALSTRDQSILAIMNILIPGQDGVARYSSVSSTVSTPSSNSGVSGNRSSKKITKSLTKELLNTLNNAMK